MKYIVSIAVDGRLSIEVEAENFKQARSKAILAAGDNDFNTMEYINLIAVNAEREDGIFEDYW